MKKLINPKQVSIEKVLKTFYKEHRLERGANKWAVRMLKETDKKFDFWIEAKLPKKILLNTLLPYHFHGEMMLVPKKGATVKETFEKLKKHRENYRKKCSKCIKTIEFFKDKDIGHIYLSMGKPNNLYDYPKMKYHKEHLVHLDGLHRLLAILYHGRINKYSPIKCFVAMYKKSAKI